MSSEGMGHPGSSSFSSFACILTNSTFCGPVGKSRDGGMVRELSAVSPWTHTPCRSDDPFQPLVSLGT